MTAFTLAPADAFGPAELHAVNVAAFADYVAGPMHMTFDQWPSFVGRQGIDLARSRVAVVDGSLAAFGLVCPRGEVGRWRLAGMAALPAARGIGVAPALLADFLVRAKAEGMTHVELECFAANERALRLYRSQGFEVAFALNAWKAPDEAVPARDTPGVRPVDRATAFAWLDEAARRVAWLPFQNTGRSLGAQPRPLTYWQCGSAQVVFSVVDGTQTLVHSLVDLDPALRDAETLAQALRVAHPGTFAPPIFRDDLGGLALARAGYVPHGLNQVLMRRAL